MTVELTPDLQQVVRNAGTTPVEFLDPETGIRYVLIPKDQLVTREDVASIQRGIEQMEAGRGRPIEESRADIAKKLGFDSSS